MITIDYHDIEIELTPEQLGQALVRTSAYELAKIVEALVGRTGYLFGEQAADHRVRKVVEILRVKGMRGLAPEPDSSESNLGKVLDTLFRPAFRPVTLTRLSDEEMAELAQTCREWTAGAQTMTNGGD